MKLGRDNSKYICVKCFLKTPREKNDPSDIIMFEKHIKGGKRIPCRVCGEMYEV
mgnify:CR=1 FL=1